MKIKIIVCLVLLTCAACQRITTNMAGTEEPVQPAEYTIEADLNKAGGAKVVK